MNIDEYTMVSFNFCYSKSLLGSLAPRKLPFHAATPALRLSDGQSARRPRSQSQLCSHKRAEPKRGVALNQLFSI